MNAPRQLVLFPLSHAATVHERCTGCGGPLALLPCGHPDCPLWRTECRNPACPYNVELAELGPREAHPEDSWCDAHEAAAWMMDVIRGAREIRGPLEDVLRENVATLRARAVWVTPRVRGAVRALGAALAATGQQRHDLAEAAGRLPEAWKGCTTTESTAGDAIVQAALAVACAAWPGFSWHVRDMWARHYTGATREALERLDAWLAEDTRAEAERRASIAAEAAARHNRALQRRRGFRVVPGGSR